MTAVSITTVSPDVASSSPHFLFMNSSFKLTDSLTVEGEENQFGSIQSRSSQPSTLSLSLMGIRNTAKAVQAARWLHRAETELYKYEVLDKKKRYIYWK